MTARGLNARGLDEKHLQTTRIMPGQCSSSHPCLLLWSCPLTLLPQYTALDLGQVLPPEYGGTGQWRPVQDTLALINAGRGLSLMMTSAAGVAPSHATAPTEQLAQLAVASATHVLPAGPVMPAAASAAWSAVSDGAAAPATSATPAPDQPAPSPATVRAGSAAPGSAACAAVSATLEACAQLAVPVSILATGAAVAGAAASAADGAAVSAV